MKTVRFESSRSGAIASVMGEVGLFVGFLVMALLCWKLVAYLPPIKLELQGLSFMFVGLSLFIMIPVILGDLKTKLNYQINDDSKHIAIKTTSFWGKERRDNIPYEKILSASGERNRLSNTGDISVFYMSSGGKLCKVIFEKLSKPFDNVNIINNVINSKSINF